jgi:hypothetical protein
MSASGFLGSLVAPSLAGITIKGLAIRQSFLSYAARNYPAGSQAPV